MDLSSFFPEEYVINEVGIVENNSAIEIMSSKKSCRCPICNTQSSKVHSHYNRFLFDLSIVDKSLSMYLTSRKFFCTNESCYRNIFTERFQLEACQISVCENGSYDFTLGIVYCNLAHIYIMKIVIFKML